MTRTEIRAINSRGIAVCSFDTEELGRIWVRNETERRGPLVLVEVTITEETRVAYRPRYIPRESFAIPAATMIGG